MPACEICAENMNRSTRKPITCDRCAFVCCRTCFIRYITDIPHALECMSCHAEFTFEELSEVMTKIFMKTQYVQLLGEIYFKQEEKFFKESQIEAEMNMISLSLKQVKLDLKNADSREERRNHTMRKFDLEEDLAETKARRNAVVTRITCINPDCNSHADVADDEAACRICQWKCCVHCRARIEDDDHECDPGVLESIQAIENSAKPCPVCQTRIVRSEGCSQMFCTNCLTLFDWDTLTVERGWRHNPVYLDWVRDNPGRADEVNSQAQESASNVSTIRTQIRLLYARLVRRYDDEVGGTELNRDFVEALVACYSNGEWSNVQLPNGRTRLPLIGPHAELYTNETCRKERLDFLSNRISEFDYKKAIGKRVLVLKFNAALKQCFVALVEFLNAAVDKDAGYSETLKDVKAVTSLCAVARDEVRNTYELFGKTFPWSVWGYAEPTVNEVLTGREYWYYEVCSRQRHFDVQVELHLLRGGAF